MHAVRNPTETVKGMARGIAEDYEKATNPNIIGGYETDITGYDPAGDPIRKPMKEARIVSRETPGAQSLRDWMTGTRRTAVNAGFAAAPAFGLAARTVINTGLGALESPDDRLRGATTGLVLGETLHQGVKLPGRAGRAVSRATDVSEGALESAAADMARATRGTSPPELMGRPPEPMTAQAIALEAGAPPQRGRLATPVIVQPAKGKVPKEPPTTTKSGIITESGGFKPRQPRSLAEIRESLGEARVLDLSGNVAATPKTKPRPYAEAFDATGAPRRVPLPEEGARRRPATEVPVPVGRALKPEDPTLEHIPTQDAVAYAVKAVGREELERQAAAIPRAMGREGPTSPLEKAGRIEMAARWIVHEAQRAAPGDIKPVVAATPGEPVQARPGALAEANRELRKRGPEPTVRLPRTTPDDLRALAPPPDPTPRISVEEANKRIQDAVERREAELREKQEKAEVRRRRWAPGADLRDETGALRRDLVNVPDDVLEKELVRIREEAALEESRVASVREAGYRDAYEELPRTERLGRKGQEDLPDAEGMVDPERLLEDNKIIAEYNKNSMVRAARERAAARIEAELATRQPNKWKRVEDEPQPTRAAEPEADDSFDFGANVGDESFRAAARSRPREYLNWARANYNQTVEARIKAAVERGRARGTIDKGYQSFEEQGARAREFAKGLLEDPLSIDPTKLGRLTGAEIEGLKLVVGENAATMEAASRVMNDPAASADAIAQATELFEKAEQTTDQALSKIVTETAQTARSLGYMRNIAKHSLDPEVWLVQAKRMLGDAPMTDEVMTNIRRLAREAAEACG